jgi:chemotaxis protein histidine kinase CheA
MSMTESREQRIAALFQSYREELPDRIAELEELWQQLKQGWDAELAVNLDHACHGLAGSAATFGFAAVGDVARAVEHILKPVIDGEVIMSAAMTNKIDVKMNALRNSLKA